MSEAKFDDFAVWRPISGGEDGEPPLPSPLNFPSATFFPSTIKFPSAAVESEDGPIYPSESRFPSSTLSPRTI